MTSEGERWKDGAFRNTVGTTEGATGPVTGGVEGHVKSEPVKEEQKQPGGGTRPVERPRGGG